MPTSSTFKAVARIALPVIAFFILAPPHLPIESIRFAPIKCGLMTTIVVGRALAPLPDVP
jgi:hypothetical protein